MDSPNRASSNLLTIESSDRDEISDYFSECVSKVTVAPFSPAGGVAVSASAIRLGPAVAVQVHVASGARFRQAEDLGGVIVALTTGGERACWTTRGREIVCGPASGFLGPLYESDTMDCPGRWGHMAFKVPNDQLARTLSHLLDQPIAGPPAFDPRIDLETAPAKALAAMARIALTPINGSAFLSTSPLAAAQFSEGVALHLLESFRHTYSDALSTDTPALKPRHVKKAIDYMRAEAERPLTLRDIAAAADISVRALHYGFRKFVGTSPFEHLRQIRLEAAYADLMHAPETVSIAEIASKWGFANPGRFATLCRRHYGRGPSEIRQTRLQARRPRA
ncbi:AraC family transcriptional regulator [Hyphomicrobium sp.]|jgi:AraC-like DNA-binding protein|uniref:AraC family transcriptional regulator n=1 Tax=Hyphomicrobium sp. TaxID=82 RepID=UPI002FE1C4A7